VVRTVDMKFLVMCKPRSGVDAQSKITPRAREELAALRQLFREGALREAYSPGGPGAVLIFEGSRPEVESGLSRLPLVKDGLVEAEVKGAKMSIA
jgi:hypothetical protein